MPPGSSDAGPFLEMGPLLFGFFCYPNNFINFEFLVYENLFFFATAVVSSRTLRKVFFTWYLL